MLLKRLTFVNQKPISSREKGGRGKHPDESNVARLEIGAFI